MITLYHGSNVRIKDIDLTQCHPYKDFGQAFYLTTVREHAVEIAKARVDIFGGEPIVNAFHFDEQLITDGSLSFKSFEHYTDEWGDFIYQHRDESYDPPYMHNFDVVYRQRRVLTQVEIYEGHHFSVCLLYRESH